MAKFSGSAAWLIGGLGAAAVVGGAAVWSTSQKSAAEAPNEELPIAKVVLYQNGVGYFERRGKVRGDRMELRVRPDQINDVLKSLSILDLAGGAPSSVALPVERSGDQLAAELPPQVRNATGMVGLLSVLRGAEVTVEGQDGTLSGRVVGVEQLAHEQGGDDKNHPVNARLTLMSRGQELVSTAVSKIRKVTIGDRALSVGLEQSLDISKREGSWKPVSLEVRLAGDNTHDLIVSYIHEVPIWRPAYRAWVEKGKGVQLQGWAVVDNVSGESWKDVELTLVVGSPLSFRYDLHKPHLVSRPDLTGRTQAVAEAPPEADLGVEEVPAPSAPPAEPAAAAPSTAAPSKEAKLDAESDEIAADMPSGGLGLKGIGVGGGGGGRSEGDFKAKREAFAEESKRQAPAAAKPMASAARGPSAPFKRADAGDDSARREAALRSAQALVTGQEAGPLYTYKATAPISVPDRSAAMINLVNRKVDGQDVVLIRDPFSSAPPFRAILMRNGKESALESGPITLYVDGVFAGEGFIARVGKDETSFIPYAKESGLGVRVESRDESSQLRLVKVVDGKIRIEGKTLRTRTVELSSNSDQANTVYVKLSRTSGWELVDPPKKLVTAAADVYVPVEVPAKGKGSAKLVEATPVSYEETSLSANVVAAFELYLKGPGVDPSIAGPLGELLKVRVQQAKVEEDRRSLQRQREVLDDEQRRIQGNLDSLPPGAVADALRKKLIGQLTEASAKAALVAKKLVESEVQEAALREQMVTLLRGISLK